MAGWVCSTCRGENPDGTRFCGHCGAPVARGATSLDEHRLITALFADLSGFTQLTERLAPEELQTVIDPTISRLGDIVGRYGGYVDKYAGDAVYAFFGAPVAHGDDAERALAAALEMRDALREIQPTLSPAAQSLQLHIGVNTGYGMARLMGSELRRDYGVLGDTVVLAQRLESVAPAGEIYVGELTARLARHRFALEPVGPVAVKGRHDPVPAYRLCGERSSSRHEHPLVGRVAELSALRSLLTAETDETRLVALVGDPGVGKSRLLHELMRTTPARWIVLEGRSHGFDIPYLPLLNMLRSRAGVGTAGGTADASAALEAACRELGWEHAYPHIAVAFGLRPPPPGVEPEGQRQLLHASVADALRQRVAEGMTALVLEDIHWYDRSTLELVSTVVRDVARQLVVATARPEGLSTLNTVAGAWSMFNVAVLDRDDLATLVQHQLGAPPERNFADQIFRRTLGNPLFALELVSHTSDQLTRVDGTWSLRDEADLDQVAPSIESVLGARLDRLTPAARNVLSVAAALSPHASTTLVLAAAPEDGDAGLQRLIDDEILIADPLTGELEFRHPMIQEVAYRRLVTRDRQRLHTRIADAIEAFQPADAIDLLAIHLDRAGAGSRAVDALIAAARQSRQLFAHDEAIAKFARAIELAGPNAAPDLFAELADSEMMIGRYDDAYAHFARAGDHRGLIGMAACLRAQGRYAEALTFTAGHTSSAVGATKGWLLYERACTHLMVGDLLAASDVFARALEWSEGDSKLRVEAHIGRALTLSHQGSPDKALPDINEAIEVAGEAPRLRAKALRVRGGIDDRLGADETARVTLHEALTLAERIGDVQEIGACLINLGALETKTENYETARVILERAVDRFAAIGHAGLATCQINLADALLKLGEHAAAAAMLAEADATALRTDDQFSMALIDRIRAEAALAAGDADGAADYAERSARRFEELDAQSDANEARAIAVAARAPATPT